MSDARDDRRARLAAQRSFDRPLILEAGAGTGKTATLVARVLAWCLGPGWARTARRLRQRAAERGVAPPEDPAPRIAAETLRGVVAITFTEAAATEMAERVGLALAAVARGERPVGFTVGDVVPELADSPDLRRRAATLRAAADQLTVSTIHAFCRRLLAQHPFEAGVHPDFTVDADGTLLRELAEEVIEAALPVDYGEPGDDDALLLAGRGFGPADLAELVVQLAAAGAEAATLADDPLAETCLAELGERLWTTLNQLLTLLETRRLGGSRARNAERLLEALGGLRRALRRGRRRGPPELEELQRQVAEALPESLLEHLRLWARGETANRAEQERLASTLPRLAPVAAEMRRLARHVLALDPELLASARRVARRHLGEVRKELGRRGVVGFTDLLAKAHDLLAGRPRLLATIRRRIDQLLVDELQDTDPRQCSLIRRLALEGPPSERPGLFVVGDPKQSIYGWRSADLAAYEAFVEAALAAGGERRALVVNFRSRPAILAEVERVVAPVMRRRPGLQPDFAPLLASRQAAVDDEHPAIEHWISWLPDPEDPRRPAAATVQATGELEARALAADLVALHERGVAWREVGILLRSLTDLELYLGALRDAGVPFVVSRDRQYFRRREILDADALVRTVLVPEDRLALVAYLRSASVGVPDAAWIPLRGGGFFELAAALDGIDPEPLTKLQELAHGVARGLPREVPGVERIRGWERNLVHAARCLGALRRAFVEEPVDLFVDRLRRSTLLEATEAARYLGAFRLANLERFFHELEAALEAEAGNRHRVLRRLRRRIAEDVDAEEARPAEATEDAVTVMTVHRAKGLEFPQVYLLETHKEAGARSVDSFALGEVDGRVEYRLLGAATPGFDRLEARRREVAAAELVRTLYVACTRAAERLVIAGRPPVGGAGGGEPPDPERAVTHLDLLRHRRGPAPTRAELAAMWEAGEDRHRLGEVAWVLPALTPPASATVEKVAPPPLHSPEEVRAMDERLRAAGEAARERQARPFHQAASKLDRLADERQLEEEGVEDITTRSADLAGRTAPAWTAAPGDGRESALVAGSAVHRLLETFDLEADPAAELERQRTLLPEHVRRFGRHGAATAAALERATAVVDRFAAGPLWRRFVALRARILVRELAVLLPPGDDHLAVGYVRGVADLVYRAADGALVVADYKTDWLDAVSAQAEAPRHTAQGEVYTRALAEALDLGERPRFELWYLAAGEVVVAS